MQMPFIRWRRGPNWKRRSQAREGQERQSSGRQLCEELRPTRLSDLIQPKAIVHRLERMARTGKLQNMLFHGEPRVGKTSAARILIKRTDAEPYELNGSLNAGIDTLRNEFENWASTCSLSGKRKVCFIDECEYLSRNSQAALRGTHRGQLPHPVPHDG